ncbi:hypothetical protein [Natrinema salaciae]|uniref:Uncharacterized protein n=1 Tax=Natrinema salaciae TaxID=1186196 RepID=A0A1H9M4X8_9EURY|nr:hypothetical protein [Natrinema salaciae]SER18193.1 hypothetical protein SAMN04489841_3188 [Natrinema salaciae]
MAPPPTAAVALLGVWVLVTLWATTTVVPPQSRTDDRFESPTPEDRSDQHDSSDRAFPADD